MARRYIKRLFVTSAIAIVMVLSFKTTGVSAASISVEAGSDVVSSNGHCSLSEAIVNVNNQSQVHPDCPAGSGNDVINLPSGTITLQSSLPVITTPVSIVGQGRSATAIDGNNQIQLFDYDMDLFDSDSGLLLKDFSARDIKNNSSPGESICIYIQGGVNTNSLRLENLNLYDCGAASVLVLCDGSDGCSGGVNIKGLNIVHTQDDSTLSYGVALAGIDDIEVEDVSISGVTVGAVLSNAKIGNREIHFLIRNTTITSTSNGISVVVGRDGSIPKSYTVDLALENNSIVSNHRVAGDAVSEYLNSVYSPAAVIAPGLMLSVVSGTTLNATLSNNLIVDNMMDGLTLLNCSKSGEVNATSSGGNMSDDDCGGMFGDNDRPGVPGLLAGIGPLRDNGGGILTMALLQGSQAIDSGINLPSTIKDARGVDRPKGLGYDIGAYESEANSGGGSAPTPPRTGEALALGLLISAIIGGSAYIVISRFRAKPTGSKSEH